MTEEDKIKQVTGTAEAATADMPDDSNVLTPEPHVYALVRGDTGERREYRIRPLCIAQMRLLTKVSRLKIDTFEENDFDKMIECISKLISEPDYGFIENAVDGPKLQELFRIVASLNYAGIPAVKGGQSGKGFGVKA